MEFDPLTLLFTNAVVLFGAATTAFLARRHNHRQVGLDEWAFALATIGVGTLMLAFFGAVPHRSGGPRQQPGGRGFPDGLGERPPVQRPDAPDPSRSPAERRLLRPF